MIAFFTENIAYFIMALGVINLLLVAVGLLMASFDWSAAKGREFLYVDFSEDKPGITYFAAARNRRIQYVRLMMAFGALFGCEFLRVLMHASVMQAWSEWVQWWKGGLLTEPIHAATHLQLWVYLLGPYGLVLLGYSFLYDPQRRKRSLYDIFTWVFIACWTVFTVLMIWRVHGPHYNDTDNSAWAIVGPAAFVVRLVLAVLIVGPLWARHGRAVAPGLLEFNGTWLSLGFLAGIIGAAAGQLKGEPAIPPLGLFITYGVIVMLVARGVMGEYERMESSRHHMGRERQVIFSFLQSIGAAYTRALEVKQVLDIILDTALYATEAQAAAIYLHQTNGTLAPRTPSGDPVVRNFFPPLYVETPPELLLTEHPHRTEELVEAMMQQSFQLGEGVIGEVAQSGEARIITDVRAAGVMLGSTTQFMYNRSMLLVPLRIRDEPLGVMAVLNKQRGSFSKDDQSMLQALADQGALSLNNAYLTAEVGQQERIRRDLEIARQIQQRLLPKECPLVPGFEIGAYGRSATEVGGDYYDFFFVDDDHLGIVVADVSGKGIYAALVAAMIRSAFRAQARGNPDVRTVLGSVNEFISRDLPQNMFVTCVYGILEIPTRRFTWARAGHEPLIVAHSDAVTDVLSPGGFALGIIGSSEFRDTLEVETLQLRSGDRMLLFTDGLTEAMNSHQEEFGMERILEVMSHPALANGHANGHPPATQPAAALRQAGKTMEFTCGPGISPAEPENLLSIERAVQTHVGDAPPSDDLTIVYLGAK